MNPLFRFATVFLYLLAMSSTLSAVPELCCKLMQKSALCCFSQPIIEVKTGYFFFADSKMQKIYSKGGWDAQLCGSCPLWNLTHRLSLNAYGAVEYFQRSGKSLNGHQKTSVWSIPINLGLKPVFKITPEAQYYFAIGPRYFYIQQHDRSPYVYKNNSKNGCGFFVNTGLNYILCKHFVVDIFGEYSYAKMRFHSGKSRIYTRNIQVGGFTIGGGLGYVF